MLKKIPGATDTNLVRLNKLIDEYNDPKNTAIKAIILQQVQRLADDLFVKFQESIVPHIIDQELNAFLNWYATNGIAQELKALGQPELAGTRAEKSFMELSSTARDLPDKNAWVYATSPLMSFLYYRLEIYSKIDSLLEDANQKKALVKPNNIETLKQYYQSLKKLQTGILDILSKEMPAEAVKPYRELLASVNKELNIVTANLPDLSSKYKEHEAISTALLGDMLYSGDIQKLVAITEKLNSVHEFTIGDFTLKRLGFTGNNKNWVATNESTGQQFLVRLMQGEDFKPSVTSRLQNEPKIAPHLTKEHIFSPLGHLETANFSLSGFYVISVSEFCPHGDLNSFLKEQANQGMNVGQRADLVANFGSHIAKIVNDLYIQGLAHPDIKAENFLVGNNGEVLISDIKFIRPMNTENQLIKNADFNTTYNYAPPEYSNSKTKTPLNMGPYSSYQLGLMLYDLAVGKENFDKFDWIDKLSKLEPDDNPADVLSFEDPIFKTAKGIQLEALIKSCIDKDPGKRPSLSEVSSQLQLIDKGKSMTQTVTTDKTDLTHARKELLEFKSAISDVRPKEDSDDDRFQPQ